MKVNILIVFFLLAISVEAQQSSITIANAECPDNTYLSFGRPVDNDPAHFMQAADFFIFNNGKTTRNFHWDKPVFIMITGNKYCPKQRIILCPGDSIFIQIKSDGNLVFEGTNAEGNNLLKEQNLLTSGTIDIGKELKSSSSKEKIISELENKKQILFAPIDKLYEDKKISKDFLNFFEKEFDMVFCHAIRGKIHHSNLTEQEKKEVLCHFYTKYNPFDSKYAGNSMRLSNMSNVARLMSEGVIPKGDIYPTGLWNEDQKFKEYMPMDCQEASFANGLQIRRNIMGIENDAQYYSNIELLKKSFPASIYLPALEMYSQDSHNSNNAHGVFVYNEMSGLGKLAQYPSMDLRALIKDYFKGTPVLVDMWATYCAPCKKEFLYNKEVHQWLDSQKIKLLYVSVDFPNNSKKWENDVSKYHLNGYHYFITSKADKLLSDFLGNTMTIPRYLLFDEEGNLLSNTLPRPSSGKFYKAIEELLYNKGF